LIGGKVRERKVFSTGKPGKKKATPRSIAQSAYSADDAPGVAMAVPSTPTSIKSFSEANTAAERKVRPAFTAGSATGSVSVENPGSFVLCGGKESVSRVLMRVRAL
jgi:hypothetical protein